MLYGISGREFHGANGQYKQNQDQSQETGTLTIVTQRGKLFEKNNRAPSVIR